MVAIPGPPAVSIHRLRRRRRLERRHQGAARGRPRLRAEGDYEITEVEGTIPTSLRGTVYRNGPGNLSGSGERFAHILDDDGGGVPLLDRRRRDARTRRSRYVRTPEFLAEEEADAVLFRNTFGTQPDPWWSNAGNLVLKNVANTNIQAWGGKVLALWEAALPVRIDPNTLDCVGEETTATLRHDTAHVTTGASWLDELAGARTRRLVAPPSIAARRSDDERAT